VTGSARIEDVKRVRTVIVKDGDGADHLYPAPHGYRLKIADGDYVNAGDPLTEGPINPQDILEVKDEEAVQNYIIAEVQKVYRSQDVKINDKHIEVIIRQMMRKLIVTNTGSSNLLLNAQTDRNEISRVREHLSNREKNGETVEYPTTRPLILGITKAALATDSFLSAASFQETTKVLTDAAVRGKTDYLEGLKENVIIGKLIPAGTGLSEEFAGLDT
ncbi:MAG: DNA-directed RNA polymerase subunit beta', partial [Oscillospiraceae bacterium]|jgi:DNA-directed RNA polymerase subunit beta'|nr:DNA-directed RNA polymerase subunit beta' [Oscillospiraceae bacterium]